MNLFEPEMRASPTGSGRIRQETLALQTSRVGGMNRSSVAPKIRKVRPGFWLAAIITLGNLLVATAFAALANTYPAKIEPDGAMGGAAHVLAMYLLARTLPLVVAVLGSIVARSRPALRALAFVAGGIQTCDAFVGALGQHRLLMLGPAIVGGITLVAASFLLRPPRAA